MARGLPRVIGTKRMIAVRFDVSESSMRRIKQPRREAGLIAPKTAAVHQPKWRTSGD
jgi:transposase